MPRGWKKAIPETQKLYKQKFLEDKKKRSFLGFKADDPANLHYILYGDDMVRLRKEIFIYWPNHCAECGLYVTPETGELDHIKSGLTERCDCNHNLQILCKPCHRAKHVHTRFGEHK